MVFDLWGWVIKDNWVFVLLAGTLVLGTLSHCMRSLTALKLPCCLVARPPGEFTFRHCSWLFLPWDYPSPDIGTFKLICPLAEYNLVISVNAVKSKRIPHLHSTQISFLLSVYFFFFFLFSLLLFWLCFVACGILAPQPEIEPVPLAGRVWSPN